MTFNKYCVSIILLTLTNFYISTLVFHRIEEAMIFLCPLIGLLLSIPSFSSLSYKNGLDTHHLLVAAIFKFTILGTSTIYVIQNHLSIFSFVAIVFGHLFIQIGLMSMGLLHTSKDINYKKLPYFDLTYKNFSTDLKSSTYRLENLVEKNKFELESCNQYADFKGEILELKRIISESRK